MMKPVPYAHPPFYILSSHFLHSVSPSFRGSLRLRDTRARAVRNVLGNAYLSSLTKNLEYEEREQLDSGSGGALSQGVGHDGSFYRYAV